MNEHEAKPLPSHSGTFTAYRVEKRDLRDSNWRAFHRSSNDDDNRHGQTVINIVEGSDSMHLVSRALGLMTWTQANVLAWSVLAAADARGGVYRLGLEVRIVPYDIAYKLDAWRKEQDATPIRGK